MSPIDMGSFLPGYSVEVAPGNDMADQIETPQGMPDARPSTPAYKVQPVVWLFVTLALCVIGLYFFLDGGA